MQNTGPLIWPYCPHCGNLTWMGVCNNPRCQNPWVEELARRKEQSSRQKELQGKEKK